MRVFCIGRNYVAHVHELGNQMPDAPVVFMKPASAVLHTPAHFTYPQFTQDIHFECEIVLRVCKSGSNISKEDALSYIDAYTLGIDFTARDLQNACKDKRISWEIAKAFDGSAPLGEWQSLSGIDVEAISFDFYQNSELKQTGNSQLLIYPFSTLIAYLSTYWQLQAGDIIFTGTPEGVGPIAKGDHLSAELGGKTVLDVHIQ